MLLNFIFCTIGVIFIIINLESGDEKSFLNIFITSVLIIMSVVLSVTIYNTDTISINDNIKNSLINNKTTEIIIEKDGIELGKLIFVPKDSLNINFEKFLK
jgi:hypothetical protein